MISRKKLLVIAGVVVLFCSGWVGGAKSTDRMKEHWEYTVEFASASQAPDLNSMGFLGWELIAVTCQDVHQCSYFLKRRQ